MAIPLAVSPSQLTPGLYLTVDLLSSAASPGTGTLRVALMGDKSSAGDLTVDSEVRVGAGEASAAVGFGTGMPAHLAAKQLYGQFQAAIVDFVAVTSGAGTATLDITFSGVPTSNNAVDVDVMGREFQIAWLVGETADDLRDKLIAGILERTSDLAVTAVSGGAGVTTINAKGTGNWGNDVLVQVKLANPATGTEAVAGAATHTNLAGGTTDPDYTTALAAIAGEEYHFILPCLSNADVTNVGSANNMSRTVDHINSLNTGLDAKLQQVICGCSTTIAAATAASVDANGAQNEGFGELIVLKASRDLPAEIAGREAGGRLAAESLDPAANRIGEGMDELKGAADVVASKPTIGESETALGGGVSLITYNAQRSPVLARAVTTHSQDDAGGPDRRLLDVQQVSGTYIVARDVRSALPQQFPQAKVTPDTEPGDDPPPTGVIEERDIYAFVVSRLRFWQRRGVVTRQSIDEAISTGSLIVKVNASDATQVDIVMPFSIVPPLAKFGVVAQRVPN